MSLESVNSNETEVMEQLDAPKTKRGRVSKEALKKQKEASLVRELVDEKDPSYQKELKTPELVRKNKDTIVNSVFVSKDYSKFKLLQGNRSVDPAHIQELINSMKEDYLQMPIHVNEKFQVIDGQHRLEVCQELNYPVYYIMHDGWKLDEVHILNTHQVNWNSLDYLYSWASRGHDQYKIFLKFMEDYKFGYQVTYALLTNTTSAPRGHKTKEFRRGKFEVADLQRANKIAEVIREFAPFYFGYHATNKFSFRDNFCLAIIRIANKNIEYIEELVLRFKTGVAPTLYHQPLVSDYVKTLEDVYNKNRHGNNKVRWV
jgi:hypothetical protein